MEGEEGKSQRDDAAGSHKETDLMYRGMQLIALDNVKHHTF